MYALISVSLEKMAELQKDDAVRIIETEDTAILDCLFNKTDVLAFSQSLDDEKLKSLLQSHSDKEYFAFLVMRDISMHFDEEVGITWDTVESSIAYIKDFLLHQNNEVVYLDGLAPALRRFVLTGQKEDVQFGPWRFSVEDGGFQLSYKGDVISVYDEKKGLMRIAKYIDDETFKNVFHKLSNSLNIHLSKAEDKKLNLNQSISR